MAPVEVHEIASFTQAQNAATEASKLVTGQLPPGTTVMVLVVPKGAGLAVSTNVQAARMLTFLDACRESIATSLDQAHAAEAAAATARKPS